MDKSKVLTVDAISYLDDVASKTADFQFPDVLKSYYLTKCRVNEKTSSFTLASKDVSMKDRCPHCCVVYSESNTSYRIEPSDEKTKFARKILRKQRNEKVLTSYQRKYMRHYRRDNKCVITCGICALKTSINLEKPIEKKVESVEPTVVKQKKKKKVDRFSGLKIEPVKATVKPTEQKTPNALTLAFSSNKAKRKLLSTPVSTNEKSENSKKTKLNKMGKLLNSKSKNGPKNSLKNFLNSI